MRQLSLSHWEGEPTPPRGHAWGPTFLATWSHRARKVAVSQAQGESAAWAKGAQVGGPGVGGLGAGWGGGGGGVARLGVRGGPRQLRALGGWGVLGGAGG